MKKNNIIRFAQALVILPVMTVTLPLGNVQTREMPKNVIVQKMNIAAPSLLTLNQASQTEADIIQAKADAIDTYFREHDMPLEGMGMKMVQAAEDNDLDWRLIAAISVRESTGGKSSCTSVKNSFLGWGSCKISFKSKEEAIDIVARNLGGNNPTTARHYDNKTTLEILHAYNPPSIVPKYAEQVMSIMESIGPADLTLPVNA